MYEWCCRTAGLARMADGTGHGNIMRLNSKSGQRRYARPQKQNSRIHYAISFSSDISL